MIPAMPLADLHTIVVGRDAMGCRFEVAFNAGEVPEATELGIAALDLVDEIEARLSIYRDSSELAAVNRAAGEWVAVSTDTFELLSLARNLHAQTTGGFDIVAGSLVRAWGFLDRQGRTPTEAELATARSVSGTRLLELDAATGRVRLAAMGAELNPGGIGKGWAIDRGCDLLAAAGVPSMLVHGGQSSVRARGRSRTGPARPHRLEGGPATSAPARPPPGHDHARRPRPGDERFGDAVFHRAGPAARPHPRPPHRPAGNHLALSDGAGSHGGRG